MDRDRYSFIAHADRAYCNPISTAKAERLIDLLNLPAGARVIDIGCGKCELLIRLVERYDVRAVGVDRSTRFTDEGRKRARERISADCLTVHTTDAEPFLKELGREASRGASFAFAACIGSTHALGGLVPTLRTLAGLVETGGLVLMGEGYWKQPPTKEYLEALGGATEGDYQTHAGNIGLCVEAGLAPIHACTASADDWDEYEWAYLRGIEEHVRAHPEDPDAAAMLERARGWREVVAKWGRDTLGFGLYLCRKM